MKKLFALLTVLGFAFAFVACGGKTESTETTATESTEVVEEAPVEEMEEADSTVVEEKVEEENGGDEE